MCADMGTDRSRSQRLGTIYIVSTGVMMLIPKVHLSMVRALSGR